MPESVYTLNLFHIGGGGIDIGPAEALFKLKGIHINLYLFELRTSEESHIAVSKIQSRSGLDIFKVPIGIASSKRTAAFHINKYPLSSSLYEPSLLTSSDCPNFYGLVDGVSKPIATWSENTQLDRLVDVSLIDLDSLIRDGVVPHPDFLSMDIQGGEYDALVGARYALEKSILGIVTEVEFFEIYKDQPLFHDQSRLLDELSFRLIDIPGFQKWFPGPAIGKGFATVAEPIFIKFAQDRGLRNYGNRLPADLANFSSEQIIKLALIAFAFQRYSYFFTLFDYLRINRTSEFLKLSSKTNLHEYFYKYQNISNSLQKNQNKPLFILENPFSVLRSRKVKAYILVRKIFRKLKIYNIIEKIELESQLGDNLKL